MDAHCGSPASCHHYSVAPNDPSRRIRHTHVGRIDTQLYGAELQAFCRQNQIELNISRAKAITYDPCYEYGIKHWHPIDPTDKRLSQQYTCLHDKVDKRPVDQIPPSAGQTRAVVQNFFMDRREFETIKQQTLEPEEENKNFCHFCVGAGRQKHLPRRKRVPPKPRIKYTVPLPYVRPKSPPPPPEPQEALYKVELKTGDAADAGTSTPIYICLIGKNGFTHRQRLGKKQGSLPFFFQRCTRETFHLKCRNVGLLKAITLEHESGRKEHGWFVDEVIVTDVGAKEVYTIPCGKWLSMWKDDLAVKRKFAAKKTEQLVRKFQITTVTGSHVLGAHSGKVFVTFVGKKRKTGKLRLQNDDDANFRPGKKDNFLVTVDDFGDLQEMRIEHDGGCGTIKGDLDERHAETEKEFKATKEWQLESVKVKDLISGKVFDFEVNEWLGIHSASGRCYTDLKFAKEAPKVKKWKDNVAVEDDEEVVYDFGIATGKHKLSGTDSTIFIQLCGSKRKSSTFSFEDKKKDKFESGATDVFRMKGVNVGDIEKIRVWHSNSGMASGWFLDKIVIKRYFTKQEIYQRLAEMKKSGRLPPGLSFRGGKVVLGAQDDDEEDDDSDDSDEDSDDSSDSDDDEKDRKKRLIKQKAEKEEEEEEEEEDNNESLFAKLRRRKSSTRGAVISELEKDEKARREARLKRKSLTGPKDQRRREVIDEEDEDEDDDEERVDRRRAAVARAQMEATGRDPEVDRFRRQSRRHLPSVSMRSGTAEDSDDSSEEEERPRRSSAVVVSLPMGEEFSFVCNSWLAKDEADGRTERLLAVTDRRQLHSQLRVREKAPQTA